VRHAAPIASASVTDDDVTVVNHPEERRYELLVAGEHAGELVYRDRGEDVRALLHTEVDPNQQRRGLGTALVAGALDDARERGLQVVPICPFVDAFVRRHPEYADLVVADPARRP
jgi:uncharacterized protein